MRIEVRVPGSCGELVQGCIDGKPFLVTCPVNLYTRVVVTDANHDSKGLGAKSYRALQDTLSFLGEARFPFGIALASELPQGKGMASSSADIAAVALAVSAAFGRRLTAEETACLAVGIEPTDGVFFDGIVRFNQMNGECLEHMGNFPRLKIAVFDTGGAVDTLAFHQRKDLPALSAANEQQVRQALGLLHAPRTAAGIAGAASCSALANQTILAKKALSDILRDVLRLGALGVNTAHSGTVLGVLFAPDTCSAAVEERAGQIVSRYPHLSYLRQVELISGGYTIEVR